MSVHFKMNGLSSIYLKKLADLCLHDNIKVLPSDYFFRCKILPNTRYIVNLSDSTSKGSHFVVVSIKENYNCVYFDSFGFDCFTPYINEKLHKYKLEKSKTQIQHNESLFCGFFV